MKLNFMTPSFHLKIKFLRVKTLHRHAKLMKLPPLGLVMS